MRKISHKASLLALCLAMLFPASPVNTQAADVSSNLPSLGDAGSAELSVQDERRLGALIMRDYRTFGAVNSDPEVTAYLNRLGARIVVAAGESPGNFEFFLVTDRAINAFAMPGGFIGVHTGLIAAAQSEDELASVLAHEVGHVTQRHIARRFGQQKQATLVTSAALIAALFVAASNPQAAQGLVAAGAGYSIDQQLGYSRDAEREADRVGFTTLKSGGFESQAMVDFFGRLQKASRLYENNAPVYLRTHPLTAERIADIQNRAGFNKPSSPIKDDLAFQLIRVKSLVFGDKTAQQLSDRVKSLEAPIEQDNLKHPVALAYGRALAYSAMGRKPEALREATRALELFNQGASMVRAGAAPLYLKSALLSIKLDQLIPPLAQDSLPALRTPQSLNPSEQQFYKQLIAYREEFKTEMSARLIYLEALQRLGLYQTAQETLAETLQIYRTNSQLFELQARNHLALGKRAEYHLAMAQSYALRGAYLPAIEQTQLARQHARDNYYLQAEIDARQREYKRAADEEREYAKFQGQ